MDFITQGIAGAALAQSGANKQHIRYATIAGLLAGLLPDLDVLIHSAEDPLLNLEVHRQFTHALIFIPIGAFIASLILWPWMKRHIRPHQLYIYCLLGYCTAGLLDACTSFGTQLFWPFTEQRIAWNLIAIIDPLFTLVLLAAVLTSWYTRMIRYVLLGLGFALCYLLFALMQQQQVMQLQNELAQARKHETQHQIVKPTLGNLLLWRSVYQDRGYYYVDAIRVGIFSPPKIYAGERIKAYQLPTNIRELADVMTKYNDLIRFNRLSQGYLVVHPDDPQVVADIRYAMLPNSIKPLWGIRLPDQQPNTHVTEAMFRDTSPATRQSFFDMLLAR